MTTKEWIKQMNSLPYYTYKGVKGVLVEDLKENSKARFAQESELDSLPEGVDIRLVEDDLTGGYTNEQEIVETEIVNPENGQRLIVAWVSVLYAEQDEMCRQLITDTDDYYDWTSERSNFKREWIEPYIEKRKTYEEEMERLERLGIDDASEQEEYDCMKKTIAEELEEIASEWGEIAARYSDPLGYYKCPKIQELFDECGYNLEGE